MAIKTNINFKGIEVQNAYIKVGNFNSNGKHLYFEINVKASEDTTDVLYKHGYTLDYNKSGNNVATQAYDYLKTLDEFKDAEDC